MHPHLSLSPAPQSAAGAQAVPAIPPKTPTELDKAELYKMEMDPKANKPEEEEIHELADELDEFGELDQGNSGQGAHFHSSEGKPLTPHTPPPQFQVPYKLSQAILDLSSSDSESEQLPPPFVCANIPDPPPVQPKQKEGRSKKGYSNKKVAPNLYIEIDESNLIMLTKYQCSVQADGGLKQVELSLDIKFDLFRYLVADILGVPPQELAIAYSMAGMGRLGTRLLLTEEGEFQRLMDDIRKFHSTEVSMIRVQHLKEAAAARNTALKGRDYGPKAPKRISDLKLMIYNNSAPEKVLGKKQTKLKEEAVRPEGLSARITHAREELQRKTCGGNCKGPCVIVPQPNGQPTHKALSPQHTDVWADHIAQGLCTASQPPRFPVLTLADATSRCQKDEKKTPVKTKITPRVPSPQRAPVGYQTRPELPYSTTYQALLPFPHTSPYYTSYPAPLAPYSAVPNFG
ncbi:hypothetical protein FRC09_010826 [Ceratobasidium sp. 395]|nr:hypothetical protein FRC09_010826 [Ceratobasidium sp. 395]